MKKQKEKEVMWEGKKLHTNEPFTPSLEGGGHGPWIYKKSPTPSSSLYIYIYIYTLIALLKKKISWLCHCAPYNCLL